MLVLLLAGIAIIIIGIITFVIGKIEMFYSDQLDQEQEEYEEQYQMLRNIMLDSDILNMDEITDLYINIRVKCKKLNIDLLRIKKNYYQLGSDGGIVYMRGPLTDCYNYLVKKEHNHV